MSHLLIMTGYNPFAYPTTVRRAHKRAALDDILFVTEILTSSLTAFSLSLYITALFQSLKFDFVSVHCAVVRSDVSHFAAFALSRN